MQIVQGVSAYLAPIQLLFMVFMSAQSYWWFGRIFVKGDIRLASRLSINMKPLHISHRKRYVLEEVVGVYSLGKKLLAAHGY